jgi:hypothetical protein
MLPKAAPAKVPASFKKTNLEIPVFDVKLFLDSAGLGRKVVKFRGKETVFPSVPTFLRHR